MPSVLNQKPKYTRLQSPVKFESKAEEPIDLNGGKFGAGIIRQASLITRGEALGHGFWVDSTFLEQVSTSLAEKTSVKARFTHPGLSSDGLGKVVAQAHSLGEGGIQGDKVLADIHFLECGRSAPDGDLGGYLMQLAGEDDTALAISIVFEQHLGQIEEFIGANSDEDGQFKSPDPDNEKNLPHARLADLRAADFVDDPAANPEGLFHRGHDLASEADKLAEFALGLQSERPELMALDIDPDRAQAFLSRFLDRHGLEIVPRKAPEEPQQTYDAPEGVNDLLSKSGRLLG